MSLSIAATFITEVPIGVFSIRCTVYCCLRNCGAFSLAACTITRPIHLPKWSGLSVCVACIKILILIFLEHTCILLHLLVKLQDLLDSTRNHLCFYLCFVFFKIKIILCTLINIQFPSQNRKILHCSYNKANGKFSILLLYLLKVKSVFSLDYT